MLTINYLDSLVSDGRMRGLWMCEYGNLKNFLERVSFVKVWGASNGGRLVRDRLMDFGVSVNAFVDTDVKKIGFEYEGLPVIGRYDLVPTDIVVIGTMYQRSVFDSFLAHTDITIVPYDDFQNEIWRWNIESIKGNLTKLQSFYNMLEDDDSKNVFLSAIDFGLTRNLTKITYSDYEQYSHPCVKALRNSIVLDGGAYNGDSASRFLADAHDLDSIFCFEPMQQNVEELHEFVEKNGLVDKVFVHHLALADYDGEVFLSEDVYSPQNNQVNKKNDGNQFSVSCVSIDSFCDTKKIAPTLIKLDVEGFEIDALRGAENTIKSCKPDLQIAIYHNPEEFIEVPLMLKNWASDYRFYLGHHGEGGFWDTVLYATVMK